MASDVLAWVNLFGWLVALIVAVLLYRDARVRLRDMLASMRARDEQIGALATNVARLQASITPEPPAPAPPVPALPRVERRVVTVTRDDDPVHTRPTVDAPAPVTPRTAPERGAVRTSDRPPPPVKVETAPPSSVPRTKPAESETRAAPSSEAIRAAYHAEADAKDARDAAQEAQREASLPPVAPRVADIAKRFQGAVSAEDEATMRNAKTAPPPPPDDDDGWDRDTGEEGTGGGLGRPVS